MTTLQSRLRVLTKDEEEGYSNISAEDHDKYNAYTRQLRSSTLEAMQRTRNGNPNAIAEYYKTKSNWYGYDESKTRIVYLIGIRALVEIMAGHIPDKQARIIDVGAGTGFAGVEIKKFGYVNVDALEPAEGLVDRQPKDVYDKVYKEYLQPDSQTTIPSNTYDVVLINGAVLYGHVEAKHFPELVRILKPGGLLIFNVGDFYRDLLKEIDVQLQSYLESGMLENVTKERSVYLYNYEDATVYTIKTASVKAD